jgi:hypothetical protein
MLVETPIGLVRIRPHHIGTFAEYWINGRCMQVQDAHRYGEEFTEGLKELYDRMIVDDGSIGILVVDGSNGDTICDLCKIEGCGTRKERDDLNIWNGSGLILQASGLGFGKVYTSREFRDGVRKIYPHESPRE